MSYQKQPLHKRISLRRRKHTRKRPITMTIWDFCRHFCSRLYMVYFLGKLGNLKKLSVPVDSLSVAFTAHVSSRSRPETNMAGYAPIRAGFPSTPLPPLSPVLGAPLPLGDTSSATPASGHSLHPAPAD